MNKILMLHHVDYATLDLAKKAFIEAGKKTSSFAKRFGFMPDNKFGASANVFSLDLKPFLKARAKNLYVTLLPEGLGTADDARPKNLSPTELKRFWYNIGLKTVAVTTNDVASAGMQPILLSLYLPSSTPEIVFNKQFMDGFLSGFVEGCRKVGCVYFSGETPQLTGKIVEKKLDIAGAVFGIMPAGIKPVDNNSLAAGNSIVLVESSGPGENGFTTLRKLAEKLPRGYRTKLLNKKEFWEAINAPSHLYTPLIQDVLRAGIQPTNIEPITGHGWQKLMRSDKKLRYVIEKMLPVPAVFTFVEEQLRLSPTQMIQIFNYGAGLAIYTRNKQDAAQVVKIAAKQKLRAVVAGHVEKSSKREVVVKPLRVTLSGNSFTLRK